jgi:hypothetical protein
VLNAHEKAKAAKLTSFIEDISMKEKVEKEGIGTEEVEEYYTISNEDIKEDDEAEDYGDEIKLDIKSRKKVVKRLPKFMLRPLPEDQEGYIMENFRNIQKRILFHTRECGFTTYLPKIETICLNLPREFAFIARRLNVEEENILHWVNLTENHSTLTENLELYSLRNIKNTAKIPLF